MIAASLALLVTLVVALAWRSAWAPAAGAIAGAVLVVATGGATLGDVEHAAHDLWRPLIVIVGIMITTSCAAELGVFARLALFVEPRTRGPVKHAFRTVFVLSALTAALLSNDAAILLVTPVVIALLRTVYPKRHPKFAVPFALAVFVAAGVAPIPTGNPMNLVVAQRAGIDLNTYALYMVPVAIAGWIVSYAVLSWLFRDALADQDPALGAAPPPVVLGRPAQLVLAIAGASIASYPVMAALGERLWPVAATAAACCVIVATRAGVPLARIARGVSWELLPFVFGVLVIAMALARVGVTGELAALYAGFDEPVFAIGTVAAGGSALINNHPMAQLHSIALAGAPDVEVLAALVGGDLGPRLLPIGSLAGLLWMHELRRQGVHVSLRSFAYVGAAVTVPTLVVSLAILRVL